MRHGWNSLSDLSLRDVAVVLGAIVVVQTLLAIGMQSVLLWPNIDAGSDRVAKAIRRFREFHHDFPLHAYKNLPPPVYIPLLNHAACCVGNSSSFAFFDSSEP